MSTSLTRLINEASIYNWDIPAEVSGIVRNLYRQDYHLHGAHAKVGTQVMKINELERGLLLRFLEIRRIDIATLAESLDLISVTERDFTGVGVYITFVSHPCLKIAGDEENYIWDGPDAFLNTDKVAIGSLFYIDNGYITTIECYTLGDDLWPDQIACYEITEG